MKKLTVRADGVRVIGNLIPDYGEITDANYYIYRDVTHTQDGTVKHLGDDRLVRKVLASKIATSIYMEYMQIDGNVYDFYVHVSPVGSTEPIDGGVVRLSYSDNTSIGLINLEEAVGDNPDAEGVGRFTLVGTGDITVNAEFVSTGFFHSSTTSIIIHLEQPMGHVGKNTGNPWTRDILYRGEIASSGDAKDALIVNYTCNPCLVSGIALTGDFKIVCYMWIDVVGANPTFGLSTTPTSLNSIYTIHNTDVQGTNISSIFTTRMQVETIEISRTGTKYKFKHGSDTVETTINNTGTLYLFINKSGNGTAVLNSMDYLTG